MDQAHGKLPIKNTAKYISCFVFHSGKIKATKMWQFKVYCLSFKIIMPKRQYIWLFLPSMRQCGLPVNLLTERCCLPALIYMPVLAVQCSGQDGQWFISLLQSQASQCCLYTVPVRLSSLWRIKPLPDTLQYTRHACHTREVSSVEDKQTLLTKPSSNQWIHPV